MANRAYLYSACEPTDELERAEDGLYRDSRHDIPLAWFFFFRDADARLVPVETWYQVRLFTRREAATRLFEQRLPLLRQAVSRWIDDALLETLSKSVGQMPHEWLVLDPNEVVDNDQEMHAGIVKLLRHIQSGNTLDTDEARAILCKYSNVRLHGEDSAPERLIWSIVGSGGRQLASRSGE